VEAVFIRAPYIRSVGNGVRVLASIDGKIFAAENDQILVTAFHPELTDDLSVFEYFLKKVG
jgi:5'-phosphate synthase pdxT subunit